MLRLVVFAFSTRGATKVLTTSYFIEPDIFWEMEYEKDIDVPVPYEEAVHKSCFCADSFGEFTYRFCIENSIWFAARDDQPFAPHDLAYIKAAKRLV